MSSDDPQCAYLAPRNDQCPMTNDQEMTKPERNATARPRAVIFDFDGTLGDSYAAIAASVNHIREHRGLPPLEVDEVRCHVGRGVEYLLKQTVPDTDVPADLARYRAHHPSVLRSGTHLLPGAAESLIALKKAGMKLAVCSNKPGFYTHELVDYLGLAPLLDAVIGPEDVARPKPAPDMLQLALEKLGVTPGEALYVGDMVVDIETARSTGVPVWVVPTGSDTRDTLATALPDRLLEDLHELVLLLT